MVSVDSFIVEKITKAKKVFLMPTSSLTLSLPNYLVDPSRLQQHGSAFAGVSDFGSN